MASLASISIRKDSSIGTQLLNNQTLSLGSMVQNTTYKFYVYISNVINDSVLTLNSNSVSVSGSATLTNLYAASHEQNVYVPSSTLATLPTNIAYDKGVFALITLDTSTLSSKSVTITVASGNASNSPYTFVFYFTVVAASSATSDISVIYNNKIISNNGSIDLGTIAQNSDKYFNFDVFNYGIPNLTMGLNSVSLTNISGTSIFSTNPTAISSVSLSFNSSSNFTVTIDTAILAENSFVITINSNDTNEPIFVFTVFYTVALAYEIVVSYEDAEISNNDTIYLGSLTQTETVTKNINISNRGVGFPIKVTDINVDGYVSFQNALVLPFILETYQNTKYTITAKMNTVTKGRKTGAVKIQWQIVT